MISPERNVATADQEHWTMADWLKMLEISDADRLRAALAAEFEIVTEPVAIGRHTYSVTRVADPDALLDERTLAESHDDLPWHPYWAQAWEASVGLAWVVDEDEAAWQDREVLDLGCGLGITGMVAAHRGATVLLADYAPPALAFAKLNCWPWLSRVMFRQVDWRRDHLERRFGMILGADIVYSRNDVPHLDAFWRQHLQAGGEVWLGDPSRPLTTPLLDALAQRGWQRCVIRRQVPQMQHPLRWVRLSLASD